MRDDDDDDDDDDGDGADAAAMRAKDRVKYDASDARERDGGSRAHGEARARTPSATMRAREAADASSVVPMDGEDAGRREGRGALTNDAVRQRSSDAVDALGRSMERAVRVSDTSMTTASSADDVRQEEDEEEPSAGDDRGDGGGASASGDRSRDDASGTVVRDVRGGVKAREGGDGSAATRVGKFPKPNFAASSGKIPPPLPSARPARAQAATMAGTVMGGAMYAGSDGMSGAPGMYEERLATSPTAIPVSPDQATARVSMPAVWTNDDPSRTLYCVLANPTVSDHALWTVLSQFGELRALSTELRRVYNAVFAVFFDVRCAERAKLTLQQSPHMFVMVAYAGTCDWIPGMENQGKFIAYNVGSVDDAKVDQELRETFSSFGELKDMRAPRGHEYHRFIEYFDTRSAEMAVVELQQTGYKGRAIQIEFAFRPSAAAVEPALPQQLSLSPESPQAMAQYMAAPMMPPQYMGWNPYGAAAMGAMVMPGQPQAQGYGYQPWPMNQYEYGHQMMPQGGYNMGGHGHQSSRTSMDYQRSPRTSENSRAGRLSQSAHDNSKINPEEFIFNMEEAEANETDEQVQQDHHHHGRTTLMIRNIPNKYNQSMMLDLLNRSYSGQYDFFYLPIDFKNKCNLGYAFVNFKCAKQTAMFYKEFHNQRWEEFNSRKVCEVTYARVQGKEAMVEHFKNSRFPCENEEYLPLVFDTDGNQTSAHTLGHTQPKHVVPAREEATSKK